MIYNKYHLEILVGGKPLKEYTKLVSETNGKNKSQSYFTDETGTKITNGSHVYAKVQKPGDVYEVKIKTNAANAWNPIIAQIYIDGYTDNSQHIMLSNESKMQNTFSNATGDTKYYFKFRNFTLSEFNQLEKQESKGLGYPGAISAIFYLARFVDNDMPTVPDFMLRSQDDIIDSKKLDTKIPTTFDKSEEKLLPPLNYEKFKNEPIAVLHLNYRPAPWFSDELKKTFNEEDYGEEFNYEYIEYINLIYQEYRTMIYLSIFIFFIKSTYIYRYEIVEEILHLQDWLDQDIITIIKEFYMKFEEYFLKWEKHQEYPTISSFPSSENIY
ncbi:Beta-hexosaminidase precursor [Gigaspora margarita]|uniref:Beta-hexosaminidase n=1 Tax=Gigaspora margarita TaxID=4874 RepID=A0A8H4EMG7_GIGMA|nr:Beta-hexosaminidase precursor [Gigaspora margarita]